MLKPKPDGTEIGIKTFVGTDGTTYLVFRSLEGSFHMFAEMEAKDAARMCGSKELANTRQMWESIWTEKSGENKRRRPSSTASGGGRLTLRIFRLSPILTLWRGMWL